VHGAAGGTGLAAVQIGKILGATVIGSARGGERLALAKANGADCVVDNEHEDFRARVLELTSGRGADVIYDPVGGDAFDASLRCIAWEGRLIVIGFASGRIPSAPANRLLVKNCSVVGLYGGSYMSRDPAVVRRALEELFTWHGQGLLAPQVSRTFRLEDVGIAMETMLARRSTGRIVLSAAPEDGDRVGLVMVPAVGVHERGLSGG
jgi:NADPH2:quinone reductase